MEVTFQFNSPNIFHLNNVSDSSLLFCPDHFCTEIYDKVFITFSTEYMTVYYLTVLTVAGIRKIPQTIFFSLFKGFFCFTQEYGGFETVSGSRMGQNTSGTYRAAVN